MKSLWKLWRWVIQFGFRLLYNELAFTYDWVSRFVSLGQWKCWQRTVFNFIGEERSQSILELAHGTGDLQRDLYERGYTAVGVDLSAAMGTIARRKLSASGIVPHLARCRAQALPFAAQSFDTLVCTFPTPFIFEAAALREIHRVLRPRGQIIMVLNGIFTTGGLHVRLLEGLYRVTGQHTSSQTQQTQYQRLLDHIASFGFAVHLERVPCRYSEAYVIVAEAVTQSQSEI